MKKVVEQEEERRICPGCPELVARVVKLKQLILVWATQSLTW